MAEHLLLTMLCGYIAATPGGGRIFRAFNGVFAAIWGALVAEDIIIALPGFLARHVYG